MAGMIVWHRRSDASGPYRHCSEEKPKKNGGLVNRPNARLASTLTGFRLGGCCADGGPRTIGALSGREACHRPTIAMYRKGEVVQRRAGGEAWRRYVHTLSPVYDRDGGFVPMIAVASGWRVLQGAASGAIHCYFVRAGSSAATRIHREGRYRAA